MAIAYLELGVKVHNLSIEPWEGVEDFVKEVRHLIEMNHPYGYQKLLDSHVEVEVLEYTGSPVQKEDNGNQT